MAVVMFASVIQTGVNNKTLTDTVPHYTEWLLIPLFAAADELLFAPSHWLLHRPCLYFIHKQHHNHKTTSAFTAYFASSLDNLIVHVCVFATPMIVVSYYSCSVVVIVLFATIGMGTFVSSHHTICGGGVGNHHLHYRYFTVNYGNSVALDKLCGTYLTHV